MVKKKGINFIKSYKLIKEIYIKIITMSKVMKYSYKNELIDEKLKSISSWIKSKHTEMTGNVYLYINYYFI